METSLGLLIVWTLSSLLIISMSVIFVCVCGIQYVCIFKIVNDSRDLIGPWSELHLPLEVGGATLLSFSPGNVLRFPSCSWTCPGVGQLNTLTRACYYGLHFVKLRQMEHFFFSPASCFTLMILHWRKSCWMFCTWSHLFCLLIPFGITLSPLCRLLSLVHHHLHALLSVWIRLQLLLPAPPCFF